MKREYKHEGRSFIRIPIEWMRLKMPSDYKIILAEIARYDDYHPTQKDISMATGISKNKVNIAIQNLVKMGALFEIGRKGNRRYYDIMPDLSKWDLSICMSSRMKNFKSPVPGISDKLIFPIRGILRVPIRGISKDLIRGILKSPIRGKFSLLDTRTLTRTSPRDFLDVPNFSPQDQNARPAEVSQDSQHLGSEIVDAELIPPRATKQPSPAIETPKQYQDKAKPKKRFSDRDYEISKGMAKWVISISAIHARMPIDKLEKHIEREADEVRKLRTIDKLDYDFISNLVHAVMADPFWSKNCRTISKMRKKTRAGDKFIWESIRDNSEHFKNLEHEAKRKADEAKWEKFNEETADIKLEDLPF